MLQSINRAKKEHGVVPVQFLKIFCTGAGAAGKTSFINLLLKTKFNEKHHSTNVVHTHHAVSVVTAAMHSENDDFGDNDDVNFIVLTKSHEVQLTRSMLITPKTSPSSLKSSSVDEHKDIDKFKINDFITQGSQGTFQDKQSQTSAVKRFMQKRKTSATIKESDSVTVQQMVGMLSHDHGTYTYQPGKVLTLITLVDTGGQPEFIHLLPTINILPTITFIIHDLSKSLDDQVLVEHSQHGEHTFAPYYLTYSNLNMIKLLMSAANDAIEKPPSNVPHLISTPGSNNASYLCFVGTHADKVSNNDITKTGSQLTTLVRNTDCKVNVWHKKDGSSDSVLFPVDNTTAGNENEDPMASLLRRRIQSAAKERDVYEFPITWMIMHLEIQNFCTSKQKSYISFDECVALAKDTKMISDPNEVKDMLLCYHLLRVLIYFEEVPGLCDYVIVNHQWWFDKLSSIITVTFKGIDSNFHGINKLKYEGILSKELLRYVKWEDDIKEEFFLRLLVHMKIIAAVNTKTATSEQYFIPFVLPGYKFPDENILDMYGYIQGESLCIHFQSGLLPRGFFCSLIVELLQNSPEHWHPHFSKGKERHTFNNLITFSLSNAFSLSLFDKISYLEMQIRHPEKTFRHPIHNKVYSQLKQALIQVCDYLNFDYFRLQYGFLCDCGKSKEDHIAIVPASPYSFLYAECSINTTHQMKLHPPQLIWISKEYSLSSFTG